MESIGEFIIAEVVDKVGVFLFKIRFQRISQNILRGV